MVVFSMRSVAKKDVCENIIVDRARGLLDGGMLTTPWRVATDLRDRSFAALKQNTEAA